MANKKQILFSPYVRHPGIAPRRGGSFYTTFRMLTHFFIAAASASAVLAGLVIVAVSVNLNRILEFSHLPARAAAAIGRLILILVSSMAALMPQSRYALGGEVAVFCRCRLVAEAKSTRQGIHSQMQLERPRFESVFGTQQKAPQLLPKGD